MSTKPNGGPIRSTVDRDTPPPGLPRCRFEDVARVFVLPADPPAAKHQHGIDCCRDCFDGLHVHPEMPGDPTCKDRADQQGRCTYAGEARP